MTARTAAQIRRLAPADWAALREVRLAALAEAPYAFSSTLERELGFDEEQWRERLELTPHFGAWRAGELVGLAAGFVESPPEGWHLVSMWVSPAERGSGAADGLVTAVCDLAGARGARRVALWVTEVNARARAFYRRAGFRPSGERALVRPSEPDHWELRMVRELP
jgi:ribosomal protein S18 acetylase RimI-like enzyme